MITVKQWLESHGRSYPEPDLPDGCISSAAFERARLPMVIACTHCTMTMALADDLPCDEEGHVFCGECADIHEGSEE